MKQWALWTSAACVCLALAATAQPAAPASSVSGTWTLNKEQSDDPTKMGERGGPDGGGRMGGPPGGGGPGGSPRGGAGRGGMRGGGGTGGGMAGRRPDPDQMRRMRDRMKAAMDPDERLVIVQSPEGVSITTGDGRFAKLFPDGKKHESLTGDGVVETTTKWDGEKLVSETKLDEGFKTTRTYLIDASSTPPHLLLVVKIEAPRMPRPMELKRVYEPER